MSDNVEGIDTLDLDRRWNRIVREGRGAPIRISDRDIQDVILADDSTPPSSHFTEALRAQIRETALEMGRQPVDSSVRTTTNVRTVSGNRREAILPPSVATGVSRWASLALVAAILLAVVGGTWYANRSGNSNQPTSIPAAAQASPEAQDNRDGASNADLGNTGVQSGPGPIVPSSIAGVLPVGINGMSVNEDAIVIEYGSVLTAYEPTTLALRWLVELPYGVYGAPVIAGDAIYMTFSAQRNGSTEAMLGIDDTIDNKLLAFSLVDGAERWSVDDAGAAPTEPIVIDGTIYAIGEHEERWVVRALAAEDGREYWISEELPNQMISSNASPQVMPLFAVALVHGGDAIAVNVGNGLTVLSTGNGEQQWAYTYDEDERAIVEDVAISGDTVVVTVQGYNGMLEDGSSSEGLANVMAFDLEQGSERWTHEFSADSELSGVALTDAEVAVLTRGTQQSETIETPTMHLLDLDSGEVRISSPLGAGRAFGMFSGSRTSFVETGPTIAGSTIYVIAGDSAPNPTGIVSAFDLGTGELRSTTLVDGFIVERAATLDGRLLIASQVEGVMLLDGVNGGTTDTPPVTDLRTVNLCPAPASELPIDMDALPEATPNGNVPGSSGTMNPDDVPAFDPANAASDEAIEAILARFAEYQGCARLDEQEQLYGFFSAGYYDALVASGQTHMLTGKDGEPRAPYFANSGEVQTLQAGTLQVLPDGRVSGIVTGQHSPRYVIWVLEDGDWKIDEWQSIVDPSDTNPEATPD